MRAAVFDGPGRFSVQDVPEPACPRGGALLEVRACAVCGSDVRIVAHGHAHIRPPQVLGHEVVGRLVATDVPGLEVGARVTLAPAVGCGHCRWCRDGRPNRCAELRTIGYYWPGAFAPLVAVPPEAVAQGSIVPVPDGLPDLTACLAEPLACCLNGQELVGVGTGDHVVVVGAGPIGVLHARLAVARGAAAVTVIERSPRRREQAEALGLRPVPADDETTAGRLRELHGDEGVDVIIVAAPSAEAQAEALGWLAPGGRISYFGGLPPGSSLTPLDTNRIHYGELTVVGAHGSSPAQNRAAMALLAAGEVSAAGLVTGRFELEQAPAAVASMARGEGLKAVVVVRPEADLPAA